MKLTIAEKYAVEQANLTSIHLYREGTFWRAYERSAYLFVAHVKAYAVVRKEVKQLGFSSAVYIGFPHALLEELLRGREHLQHAESYIELLNLPPVGEQKFEAWKLSFPLKMAEAKAAKVAITPPMATLNRVGEEVLQRVQRFRLELASPVDCFLFVRELKDLMN